MRCIDKFEHAHWLAFPSRNFWFVPVDYRWRHDIRYDHSAEARRCHGYLGSGSFDGAGDWTCSWWIPGSGKRMAVGFLGNCHGSKFNPSARPIGRLAYDAIGWRHHHLSLLFSSRILPSHHPRAQGEKATKRDRQRKPQIQAGISSQPGGSLQTLHRPPHEATPLFAYRSGVVNLYGCGLWLSISSLHHHYRSVRRSIPFQSGNRGSYVSRHWGWVVVWGGNLWLCERQNLKGEVEDWRDEGGVSTSTYDSRIFHHTHRL